MNDLPGSWEWATLGAIADTQLGKMLSMKSKTGVRSRPYLRNINVQWHRIDLDDVPEMDFTEEESVKYALVPGDLLVCEGGEVGRTATWRGASREMHFQKALHRVRPLGGIEPKYLEYAMRWSADTGRFARHVTGSTISHLPQQALREVSIPVPPLPEQRRIVAAIEEHSSRLDSAEANARSAVRRAEALAQSLIDSSLRGPATKLGDVLAEPLRNGLSAKSSPTGATRVLTLTAVTDSTFSEQNTKLIDSPGRSMDDLWLRPDDIFIQRSNTPELVGTAAIYKGPAEWAIFPDLLIRVRVGVAARPDYVALALRSSATRSFFQRSARGIAGSMPKISQPVVEQAKIPLPSVQQQDEIIARYALASDEVAHLNRQAGIALNRSRSLRRSILAAAFSGQLVPQDLSDEPVSAMLERIANERGAPRPTQRKRAAL